MQNLPSSVHKQETTVKKSVCDSYSLYSRASCQDEWQKTHDLYFQVDRESDHPRHERLVECRQRAWFLVNRETRDVRVASNQCRLRWCPLCSKSLQNYRMQTIGDWLHKADHPKFLTFTLKHSNAPLEHQIETLYSSFRKLRLKKQYRALLTGGIWFFQILKSKATNQWHPHLHCIVTGKYVPQKRLSNDWLKITGTSSIVDIRVVSRPEKVAYYVSRYSARPANLKDLDNADAIELISALHGKRLCGTWGDAKKISLKPPPCENPDEWMTIGSWLVVTQTYYYSENSKLILDAFLAKKPLPDFVNILAIEDFVDGKDNINWLLVDLDDL